MKSIEIKSYILVSLIALSLCASLERVTRTKSKTETKSQTKEYNGDGSWNGGFNAPKMDISRPSDGSVLATSGRYSFNASKFSSKDGWVFKMDNIPAEIQKFVQVNAQGNTYIPWRYFNDVASGKLPQSYKYIFGSVTNDEGLNLKITFYMPWAAIGNYITTEEVSSLRDSINGWKDAQKTEISTSKKQIYTLYQNMVGSKKAKDTATQDAATVKATLEAAILNNQNLIKQHQTNAKALNDSINKATVEITNIQAQIDALQNIINENNTKYENNLKLIDDKSRLTVMAELDKTIETETNDVNSALDQLNFWARNNLEFTNLRAAALKGDSNAVINSLVKIAPIA